MQTIAIRIIVLWFWLYDLIWLKKSYVVLVKDNHFFIPNFPFEVEDFEPTITPSLTTFFSQNLSKMVMQNNWREKSIKHYFWSICLNVYFKKSCSEKSRAIHWEISEMKFPSKKNSNDHMQFS